MFKHEDIENLFFDHDEQIESLQDDICLLGDQIAEMLKEGKNVEEVEEKRKEMKKLEAQLNELESYNGEMQEIFEWWLVSDWLAEKLEEKGKPVLKNEYGTYWGRTATGQALFLDGVISQICHDLEILESQKNSWAGVKNDNKNDDL